MEKRFARSRGLLATVALAVIAAMCTVSPCTVSPAYAASSASAGRMSTAAPHDPAASGKPCNFVQTLKTCKSTDPTVAYYHYAQGDISH